LAWAHEVDPGGEREANEETERQLPRGDDNYRPGGPATRGSGWSDGGVKIDDNYGGGDDNYLSVVVKMGAVGRAEERGRNRQK
jgi:hypothetical protein